MIVRANAYMNMVLLPEGRSKDGGLRCGKVPFCHKKYRLQPYASSIIL